MTRSLDAEVVSQTRGMLAEGPLWDARARRLLWVDIPRGQVHRLDPATGVDEAWDIGSKVGAVALRSRGGVVLADERGFALWSFEDRLLEPLNLALADDADLQMNDGTVDAQGRFWAGTAGRPEGGSLYRLDPDHSVSVVLEGVSVSNGLDWSLDGQQMYYIDTPTGGVDVFSFEPDVGRVSGRQRLINITGGRPDGMTVDAEGCLWVALWMGRAVHRYTPAGRLDTVVHVPVDRVTSCAFAGEDLEVLYITTAQAGLSEERRGMEPLAGGIFACQPGTVGRLPHEYRG